MMCPTILTYKIISIPISYSEINYKTSSTFVSFTNITIIYQYYKKVDIGIYAVYDSKIFY